ncbi:MAG: hypothetical protein AAB660_01345 [Patescibacteria group bacterium]
MGYLEARNVERVRRRNLQQIILHTVTTVGVIGVGLLAPNVIGAMNKLGLISKPRQREYIASAASKLKRKGFLKFENGRYQLTRDGEGLLQRWEMSNFKIPKPKKWDRKWRVVIFDIPEKKKTTRDKLTILFRQTGFERLQDSVWVYPYDCEDLLGTLKTDWGIGKDLLYMIVDEIENDKHLRSHFDLV